MNIFLTALFLVAAGGTIYGKKLDHRLPRHFQFLARFQRDIQHVHRQILEHTRRTKRDYVQVSFVDKLECMNNCMQVMLRDLRNIGVEGENNEAVFLNKELLENDAFEEYCDISQEGKTCLRDCDIPASIKNGLDMAFAGPNYICIDHYDEIRQFLPCFRGADSEVDQKCIPMCGDPMRMLKRTQDEIKKALRSFDLTHMKVLLEDQCKYLRCNAKCHTPILNRHCSNTRAAELLNDMALVTLRKAQNLLKQVPTGWDFWPKTCRRIADQGFPTITNRISLPKRRKSGGL